MTKAMVFVDGTWLYANLPRLAEAADQQDFRIDYGLLPGVLGEEVKRQSHLADLDIVRIHFFGSYPANYDPVDTDAVQKRWDFFGQLKEDHYELELYPIDFRGERLRPIDRDPQSDFEPAEKCVDVALATSLTYYATVPDAFDIAIVIVGDRDYLPALQRVRRLGKRVAIASIARSCAKEYDDPYDNERVKDFDIVWLDDLRDRIELKFEIHTLECQSHLHVGDRAFQSTYYPKKGQPVYCDTCRVAYRQRVAADTAMATPPAEGDASNEPEEFLLGEFEGPKVTEDGRPFGFIRYSGSQYYCNPGDLDGAVWGDMRAGTEVRFQIKRPPPDNRHAGAARRVQIVRQPDEPAGVAATTPGSRGG